MIQKLSIFTVCIVILPLILSRSSCSGEEPPKPKVIKLNRELKEMEFVRYWLKDHANIKEGGVELDFVLRFAADKKVTLAELGPGRASHSFLVFILPGGHRIFVSFMRPRKTIGIYAYDRTLKRNLIQKAFPIVWKQGEAHKLRVDWGKFLTLHVDGRKLFSKRWEGLAGPWEIKGDQKPLLLVGSMKMWAHTQSDFLARALTFFPRPSSLHEELKKECKGPADLPPAQLSIPRLGKPPKVDGAVEADEWSGAGAVTGFTDIQTMNGMEDATVIHAGYTQTHLYFGIRAFRKQAQLIDSACHERDGAVYRDDAIEIFLRPGGRGPYFQFIGNSFGSIYDGHNRKPSWNGHWQFRTQHSDTYWSGEVAIAFEQLGRRTPEPGESWAVNFCRELPNMSQISSWSLMTGKYDRPERFGRAVFTDGAAARVLKISGYQRGDLAIRCGATAGTRGSFRISDGRSVLASAEAGFKGNPESVQVKLPDSASEGEFLLEYEFTGEEGKPLAYGRFPFSTLQAFDVSLRKYPSLDYVEAIADLRGMSRLPKGAKVQTKLLGPAKKALVSMEGAVTEDGRIVTLRIPTDELTPETFALQTVLVDGKGKVHETRTTKFEKRPRPWWFGSKAGITDKVLPPWTPMKRDGTTIACWGRKVKLGGNGLPVSIISQDKELLAAPIRLISSAGDRQHDPAGGTCKVVSEAGHEMVFKATGASGPLKLATQVRAEYDGMIRFDLTISGPAGATVNGLTLEIPLRAEHSILMHENDGSNGWAGMTGDKTRSMVFRPVIWLGDDDRGLCWFAESPQDWHPTTAGAIEIKKSESRSLSLNFIREKTAVGKGLSYTFGLLPTPVRPVPKYMRNARLATSISSGMDSQVVISERIAYPAAGNLDNRRGTLELWLTPAWPEDEKAAKPFDALQELAAIQYGAPLNRSYLDLYYSPGHRKLLINHMTREPHPKTGQLRRVAKRVLTANDIEMKPGHYDHVALTWGDELALYFNGKRVASAPQKGLVPKEEAATLPQEILALGAGDAWRHRTAFVFDEVRVSSRPRNATELAASKPVKDKDVLLLDHLAGSFTPDGEAARTTPEVSSRPNAGGVPTLGCTFVPAKFGRGVRAVVQPPGSWLQYAHDHLGLTHALDWRWHRYMGAVDLLLTPEVFRSRIEAIHRKGLKYYVYAYKAINPLHPNYDEYFHEWGLLPRTRWMNPSKIPTARNYDADSTCANSPYTDYFVASFEKVLKESDLDGIYMDGNTKASLCANSHHGCGYRDPKGQWQGTYPIFATREMLKRLYAVTHLNKPEGIVDVHQSFCLCIPTTSFCDIIYTGEHEPFSPERLPEIRVRYARRAWGIPIETLGSTPLYVRYARRYWAYMLIHDARVRPGGANGRNDMQRKTARIRGVIEPFREPGCKWLPYYRPSPFESRTGQVLVSAWGRPKGDYMLAVACFAKAAGTTESRISLNLNGEWKATNPLTDEVFSIENEVLHLKLGYEDFRLVHLEKIPRQ